MLQRRLLRVLRSDLSRRWGACVTTREQRQRRQLCPVSGRIPVIYSVALCEPVDIANPLQHRFSNRHIVRFPNVDSISHSFPVKYLLFNPHCVAHAFAFPVWQPVALAHSSAFAICYELQVADRILDAERLVECYSHTFHYRNPVSFADT